MVEPKETLAVLERERHAGIDFLIENLAKPSSTQQLAIICLAARLTKAQVSGENNI